MKLQSNFESTPLARLLYMPENMMKGLQIPESTNPRWNISTYSKPHMGTSLVFHYFASRNWSKRSFHAGFSTSAERIPLSRSSYMPFHSSFVSYSEGSCS